MTNIEKYESKNPLVQIVLNKFIGKVKKKLDTIEYNSVIDIGCGEGFLLQKISLNGKKIVGIDINEKALKLARKNFPQATYVKSDIYKIPFKPNSFDVAICLEVIEHLKNPEKGY